MDDFSAVISQLELSLEAIDSQIDTISQAAADQEAACAAQRENIALALETLNARCEASSATAAAGIAQLEAYRSAIEAQLAVFRSL